MRINIFDKNIVGGETGGGNHRIDDQPSRRTDFNGEFSKNISENIFYALINLSNLMQARAFNRNQQTAGN